MEHTAISMLKQAQVLAMIKVMEKFSNTSTPATSATAAPAATTTTPAATATAPATTPAATAATTTTPATTPAATATPPAATTPAAATATTPATTATKTNEDKKTQNTAVVNTMDTLKWVFIGIGIFVGLLLIGGLIYWIYTMFTPSSQSSQQAFQPSNSSDIASSSLATPQQSSQPSKSMNYSENLGTSGTSGTLGTSLRSDDLNMYTTLENDNSTKQFDSIDDYLPSMDTYKTSNNSVDNMEFYNTNTKPSSDNDVSENYSYVSDTDLPSTQEDRMKEKQAITGGIRKTKSRNLGSKKNQRKAK